VSSSEVQVRCRQVIITSRVHHNTFLPSYINIWSVVFSYCADRDTQTPQKTIACSITGMQTNEWCCTELNRTLKLILEWHTCIVAMYGTSTACLACTLNVLVFFADANAERALNSYNKRVCSNKIVMWRIRCTSLSSGMEWRSLYVDLKAMANYKFTASLKRS